MRKMLIAGIIVVIVYSIIGVIENEATKQPRKETGYTSPCADLPEVYPGTYFTARKSSIDFQESAKLRICNER